METIYSRRRPRAHGSQRKLWQRRLVLEQLEDRTLPSVSVLGGFAGMDFNDSYNYSAGYVPPDTIAAGGPTQIVETVNTVLRISSKTGAAPLTEGLGDFFAPVLTLGGLPSLTDPVVAYDELAQRFVVAVLDTTPGVQSDLLYAVSNSSTASLDSFNGWQMHRITFGPGQFADFPRFGWNFDEHVFTVNIFQAGLFSFTTDVVTIDKSSALNPGATFSYQVSPLIGDFTLVPAVMHSSKAGDPMWLVEEATYNGGSAVYVVKETANHDPVTGLLLGPDFTYFPVSVDLYTAPPNASQKGGGDLQTNDSRMLSAEYRVVNGISFLAAAQTVGLDSDQVAHVRWYEFNTGGSAPTLVQQGTLSPGAGIHTYFPSIAIAGNGNLGLTFMQSSSSQFVSMYVSGRTPTDAPGTMETPALAKAGQATYAAFDGAPYRAGDYSGITVDPNDGSFWAANEYAIVPNNPYANWGTWISHFTIGATGTTKGGPKPKKHGPASPATNASALGVTPRVASAIEAPLSSSAPTPALPDTATGDAFLSSDQYTLAQKAAAVDQLFASDAALLAQSAFSDDGLFLTDDLFSEDTATDFRPMGIVS